MTTHRPVPMFERTSEKRYQVYRTQEYEFDLGTLVSQESSDKIEKHLPDHERLNLIGSGGNARVWQVRLDETDHEAAIQFRDVLRDVRDSLSEVSS
jgi:hypothetical protein